MKKIFNLFLVGFLLIGLSYVPVKAEDNKLMLNFAENCKSRDGCEIFPEQGDDMVKNETLNNGDRIVIDIMIQNPEGKNINSVASWVKYNPALLKPLSIEDADSVFDFPAPDGSKINEKDGLVQIGRAKIGGDLTDSELYVASIIFEVITDQKTSDYLEFFNYQTSELGNTGVFSISGLLTDNILETAPKKLKINFNSGSVGATGGANGDDSSLPKNPVVIPDAGGGDDVLDVTPLPTFSDGRPTNLRIKSEKSAQAELVWDFDVNKEGYFVYYSTNSGVYLFRKDIGKTNHATIKNLENGKKYYFAITSYDNRSLESDFSDEVYATIGVKGSESHPFSLENTVKGDELVDPVKGTTEETGPKDVAFLALALSVGLLLFKKSFSLLK